MLLVGDIHGAIHEYKELIKDHKYSLQVGDFGFDYSSISNLNPEFHKFLPGNHDNYKALPAHALDLFGNIKFAEKEFFYVRGAHSVDKTYRIARGYHWFEEEQLTYRQFCDAIKLYEEVKPKIMITHDCPESIQLAIHGDVIENRTSQALQNMLDIHRPNLWVFGHHHVSYDTSIDGTRFVCLNIMETMEI